MTAGTRRVGRVLAKDLRLGPRSPMVLWALVLPVVLTVLLRGIFGGLLDSNPRLGVLDAGGSEITTGVRAVEGIEVQSYFNLAELEADVLAGDLDAGLALPAGFDDAVRGGQQPPLQLWISGQSLASSRGIIIAALLGLLRDLSGDAPRVDVEVVQLGEAGLPLDVRLLPLLVVMAVAIAGAMVPAASLVEEKEKRTLLSLLVSPASMGEVLTAKGVLGWLLAMAAGLVTLAINGALGAAPVVMVVAVALGAVMMVEVGLLLGVWARDTNTLFAAWKGGALFLLYPVAFFVWTDLPGWIPRLGPTYYFLRPIFALSVEGAAAGDVWIDLVVAAAICAVLVPAVIAAGRRLERGLASGAPPALHQIRRSSDLSPRGDKPEDLRI